MQTWQNGGLDLLSINLCAVITRFNIIWYFTHHCIEWSRITTKPCLDPHKALHNSPSRASYGVSIVRIWEENDRVIDAMLLHDRSWISPRINSISNELDIIVRVITSQLSGHRGVISNWLWRHQQNENWASVTRGQCVQIVVFIVIYGFVMSWKKYNNVCTLVNWITLWWALKQFVTRVHTLFSIYSAWRIGLGIPIIATVSPVISSHPLTYVYHIMQ